MIGFQEAFRPAMRYNLCFWLPPQQRISAAIGAIYSILRLQLRLAVGVNKYYFVNNYLYICFNSKV